MRCNLNLWKPLFFALVFFSCLHTIAQTPPVWVGIQGGPAYNSFRGNEWIEDLYDPAVGFLTGLTLDHPFTPVVSVVSSLNYEQKRTRGTLIATDETGQVVGDIQYRASFQYFTWPILARATFGHGIRFFINGGPYLGFLIKQKEKMTASFHDLVVEPDNTENFKTLEFGLIAGVGAAFPLGERVRITLELRDHLGLNNISALEIANDGTIKTNSLFFLVGLSYGLGGEN